MLIQKMVQQNIEYKREVFEDDLVYVMSSLKGFSNKVFNFEHELWSRETNQISAIMDIKLVILDLDKRRAVPLPSHLTKKLEEFQYHENNQ